MKNEQEYHSHNDGSRTDGLRTADELHLDAQLAQRACEGDDTAKQQVVELIFDRVWKTMSFMSNDDHDVDDLTQNALMAVLSSLPSYRGHCPLVYWAEKVAVRTAAKKFEKQHRRTRLLADFRQETVAPHVPSVEDLNENEQLIDCFQRCLDRLSDVQRTAIVAHHINGYTLEEIATMCECSVFTIKGRLRRGRRRLKNAVMADPTLSQWVKGELNGRVPR